MRYQGSTGTFVNIEGGPEVPSPFLFKVLGGPRVKSSQINGLALLKITWAGGASRVSESEVANMLG